MIKEPAEPARRPAPAPEGFMKNVAQELTEQELADRGMKVCRRCGGTGQYSYNHRDGTMCYGCGGTGVQALRSKKTIETRYAEPGDMVMRMGSGLCEILEVIEGEFSREEPGPLGSMTMTYAQKLRARRLYDGKIINILRHTPETHKIDHKGMPWRYNRFKAVWEPDWEQEVDGVICTWQNGKWKPKKAPKRSRSQ